VRVSISDSDGSQGQASSTVTVADAPLTVTSTPLNTSVGSQFDGLVATFTDSNTSDPASLGVPFHSF